MARERVLFRVAEAAEIIGCSRQQMYVLLAKGVVPSVRIGKMVRVPAAELHALIAQAIKPGPAASAQTQNARKGDGHEAA